MCMYSHSHGLSLHTITQLHAPCHSSKCFILCSIDTLTAVAVERGLFGSFGHDVLSSSKSHHAGHVLLLPSFLPPASIAVVAPPVLLKPVLVHETTVLLTLFISHSWLSFVYQFPWALFPMAPHLQLVGSGNTENQSDAGSNLTEIFSDNILVATPTANSNLIVRIQMMKMSLAIIPSTMRASFNGSNSDLTQERLDDNRMYRNRSATLLAVRLCLKLTDGSLAGTASILVSTQCSTGHWQWISDTDETVRFLYAFFWLAVQCLL